MSTTTVSPTIAMIVAQMQENTGRSILDSGDAYGRGFERKAGVPAEVFEQAPPVRVDEYGVTLDAVHWLADRVEYHPEGDAFFREWVDKDDEGQSLRRPWMESMERFVQWVFTGSPEDTDEGERTMRLLDGDSYWSYNTYNGESLLSETLQWVAFKVPDDFEETHGTEGHWDGEDWVDATTPGDLIEGEWYLLLQTHNGCDVRGGYSGARLYSLTGSEAWYALAELDSFELYCDREHTGETETGWYLSHRSGEWSDRYGFAYDPWEGLTKGIVSEGGDKYTPWPLVRVTEGVAIQCPKCFLPMQPSAAYVD
jgi:hypothetical protein